MSPLLRLIAAAQPPGGRPRWPQLVLPLILWIAVTCGRSLLAPGEAMIDTDGYMHVVHRWEVVERGSFAGGFFSRDGAPDGMVLHWTMPYDALALTLAAPMVPFKGWHDAIRVAAPWSGVVTGIVLLFAVVWAMAPGGNPHAGVLASMLTAGSIIIGSYGHYGRDDHHLLILAAWVVVAGTFWRLLLPGAGRGSGALLGLSAGMAMWIALESAPPALAAAIGLAVLAALDPQRWRAAAVGFAVVFPATVAAALWLDPPAIATTVDRLSPLYFGLAVLASAVCVVPLSAPLAAQSPGVRLGIASLAAACAGALGAWLFQRGWAGGHAFSDPEVARQFLTLNEEKLPPEWPGIAFAALGPGLIGLGAGVWLAATNRERRPAWLLLSVLLIALLAAGTRHLRFCLYASVLGPALTAAALAPAFALQRASGRLILRRAALVVAAALAPLAPAAIVAPTPRHESHCATPAAAAALGDDATPGAIVLADINLSPPLLYYAPAVRTVAGPYHTNPAGLVDVFHAASTDSDAALRGIVARRRAAYLLLCNEESLASGTVRRRLLAGEPPEWLRRLPLNGAAASDLRLYKVVN